LLVVLLYFTTITAAIMLLLVQLVILRYVRQQGSTINYKQKISTRGNKDLARRRKTYKRDYPWLLISAVNQRRINHKEGSRDSPNRNNEQEDNLDKEDTRERNDYKYNNW